MNQRARVTEYLIERLRLTFNDAMQGDEFGGSRRRPFGLTKEVARAAAADALEHFCAEAIEVLADDTFENVFIKNARLAVSAAAFGAEPPHPARLMMSKIKCKSMRCL